MRRALSRAFLLLLSTFVVGAAVLATPALADPSHNVTSPVPFTCDNGQTVVMNIGTVTNQSHQAFVISSSGTISSTSIYVVNYLAFTDSTGTFLVFDTAPALTPQVLVNCTGDLGGGATLTTRGFFTPGT